VRFSTLATYSSLIHQFSSADSQISWLLDWTSDNRIRFHYSPDGTTTNWVMLTADWTPAINTWHHVAVDRDSSQNLRVYVDGNVLINTPVSAAFHNSTTELRIGRNHAGWIDEVRITKGAAVYGGSFIPPGEPFPAATAVASAN
jgi:hypothetical protein